MALCSGCKQTIKDKRRFLICSLCKEYYDLDCANVTENRFHNIMTGDHKNKWKCQACICKMPKQNNSNTPVRTHQLINSEYDNDQSDLNITKRRKPQNIGSQSQSLTEPDIDDITGNTDILNISVTKPIPTENPSRDLISLDKFSQLLDTKLEKIKDSILTDIKETIQIQLADAIQKLHKDSTESSINIIKEQKEIKEQINIIDTKIKNIESQLENLEISKKKIVLYGLPEYQNENEYNLYDNINKIFADILDLDTNPYIEEIKRIGKRGTRRPIEIEFISRRFAKYIVENSKHFKNTGLAISAFMTREKLQERNILKQKLQEARQNGCHAVIRNNKLFINGLLYENPTTDTQSTKFDANVTCNEEHQPPEIEKETPISKNNTFRY